MDPFNVLGVSRDVTVDNARSKWREKARACHPDVGGSDVEMQEINEALRLILAFIADREKGLFKDASQVINNPVAEQDVSTSRRTHTREGDVHMARTLRDVHWARTSRDVSSFTIDCLPVEAFEALLIAASWHGDISVDESPYLLEMVMRDPYQCWIRFDIVPEAGASMVSVSVATARGEKPVSSEAIRDVFVDSLNHLNWEDIHS